MTSDDLALVADGIGFALAKLRADLQREFAIDQCRLISRLIQVEAKLEGRATEEADVVDARALFRRSAA